MQTKPLHEINLPLKIVIGRRVVDLTGEYCNHLFSGNKMLVLTGPHVYGIAGKKVIESLEDAGLLTHYVLVKGSTLRDVEAVREVIREVKPSALIAVGGGKVIDVAKYSSFLEDLPFVSVPTSASHDGIASPVASIKDEKRRGSFFTRPPALVIADVAIISNAPQRLIASGCGDVIAKLTAVRDAKLARLIKGEYVGDYALSLALLSARMVLSKAELIAKRSEEGIRTLIEALISCGVAMAIAGSSRPCSGSEHLFSHALDIIAPTPALHGEQVGVGTIMMSYLHGIKWLKVRNFLKKVGAPTNAKELGIDDHYIVKALTIAHKIRRRYTILGESGLTWRAAEELARTTEVIS